MGVVVELFPGETFTVIRDDREMLECGCAEGVAGGAWLLLKTGEVECTECGAVAGKWEMRL